MGIGSPNREAEPRGEVVIVSLEGAQLGHEIRGEGNSYALFNTFAREAQILGGDRFTQIYFRTQSGNIYKLEDKHTHARLINRNASKLQGRILGYEFLDVEYDMLANQNLVVGQPFQYGNGTTTPLTEIVPVTGRMYDPAYMTRFKPNSISEDFKRDLPQTAGPTS